VGEAMNLSDNLKVIYSWEDKQRKPVFGKINCSVHAKILLYLKFRLKKELYRHQVEAISAAIEGRHVGICTSTASGKSLCFAVPVLNQLLQNKNSRALFVFPIKALSNDQLEKLKKMALDLGLGDIVRKFDGDVNGPERQEAIRSAKILISTPDVLHATLLRDNNKKNFQEFFQNLKFVVIDECHIYNGVFGSNFAYVLRRLRQLCLRKNSDPQFILASATIGEPEKFFHSLTGINDIKIIAADSSPSHGKKYLLVEGGKNAFLRDEIIAFIIQLISKGTRFIVFSHTRKDVENLYLELKRRSDRAAERIMPYRAGYESADRKRIEDSLRSGTLVGVFSTSALEVGIDISELEVCILLGLPGSKSSFLQRVGRVGRGGPGEVFVFKMNNAYDDYYFRHPEEFFKKVPEPNILNLLNRQLMLGHFSCARTEAPNFDEPGLSGSVFPVEFIRIADRARDFDFPDEIFYSNSPHFDIQIRNIADPVYRIIAGDHADIPPMGTISYSQLLREAYIGAAYLHMGKKYLVQKISYTKKAVFVSPRCSYSRVTKPICEVYVKERPTTHLTVKSWPGIICSSTSLGIFEYVRGFIETGDKDKKETYYQQPLMRYFVTRGNVISLKMPGEVDYAGVQGVATVLENTFPLLYPCTQSDINSYAWTKGSDEAKIYLYDNVAGGLDITVNIMDLLHVLLNKATEKIINCNCGNEGCINCIVPTSWYSYQAYGNKESTLSLLRRIAENTQKNSGLFAEKQDVPAGGKQKYGKPMLTEGSVVFTGKCEEGVVRSSQVFVSGDIVDRIYNIKVNNREASFLGRSLTLIQGRIELWCTSCGQESIDPMEQVCPTCKVRL
jgi:DEAD/DEAH box helicase domain-containing protein